MLLYCLAVHQLRPDDVAHRIGYKHRGRHDGLLCGAGNVARAERDDQAYYGAEEACDGVSGYRRGWLIAPFGFPDHDAPGDDGEATGDEHGDAGVGDPGGDVAAERDEDDADGADGELKEDGVEGVETEGGDDEWPEARYGAVDGVSADVSGKFGLIGWGYIRRGHHDRYEVELHVEKCFLDLIPFYLLTADARLAFSESLDSDYALFGGQEPSGNRRVGHDATPDAEEKGQGSGKDVDVLPSSQRAGGDLSEGVVQCSSDDGEPSGAGEPPGLTHGLLLLSVVATDDGHEAGWNDTFHESCSC